MKKWIVFCVTSVVSCVLLFFGNRYATEGMRVVEGTEGQIFVKAVVTEIMADVTVPHENGGQYITEEAIVFNAKLLEGENKGEIISASQVITSASTMNLEKVEPGDRVIVVGNVENEFSDDEWNLAEYCRSDALALLGAAFILLLILFGRKKGVRTIVSLAFTCVAIFGVFVPSILSGHNIYVWSVAVCIFIIAMTLLIVNGATKKSLTAAVGCVGGVVAAGLLTVIMDRFLRLTGVVDEQSVYLQYLSQDDPIDLKAIIFAAIIIGAVGAIMDVAVDISASLHEVSTKIRRPSFGELFRSGMTIGRDIMGTMSNTLVLAYIGSSLSVVVLLVAYNANSLTYLFNREMIVVEILQALVGSIGILLTIPLTSAIAAALFSHRHATAALAGGAYGDTADGELIGAASDGAEGQENLGYDAPDAPAERAYTQQNAETENTPSQSTAPQNYSSENMENSQSESDEFLQTEDNDGKTD